MDTDDLLVCLFGLICFLVYKMLEQNNKVEKLKMKVLMQARNNAAQSLAVESRKAACSDEDTDESDTDEELNEILEAANRATGNNGAAIRLPRTKRSRITFVQNITGPSNNDNLNFQFGLHLQPLFGGGLGAVGAAFASGASNRLTRSPERLALPAPRSH